jgi:hypothetical protein
MLIEEMTLSHLLNRNDIYTGQPEMVALFCFWK